MDQDRPTTTEPIPRINKRLMDMWGKTMNRPTWRVIASWEDIGKELVYASPAGILYSEPRVEERKRYAFLPDCYMLQKYSPAAIPGKLVEYTYETVYPFLDKDDKPLPVEWSKIYFYVSMAMRGPQATAEDILRREGRKESKEVEGYVQQFGEHAADHSYGRGISLAGLDARPSVLSNTGASDKQEKK